MTLGSTKSADYKIKDYYVTQKYTQDKGGAQDSQKNDAINFLRYGSINHKVMAIADGNYWDNNEREGLKELFHNNKNVIITSIDELKGE